MGLFSCPILYFLPPKTTMNGDRYVEMLKDKCSSGCMTTVLPTFFRMGYLAIQVRKS
jgi:hypothetical protein